MAASCVTGTIPSSAPTNVTEQIGQFTDQSTLSEAFDISAKAQANFVFGSADAETKYELNRKLTNNSAEVAVRASFRQIWTLGTDGANVGPTRPSIDLRPDVRKTLMKDRQEFVNQCGDGYVFAIESGATVAGFFSFASSTQQSDESLLASVKGSFLGQSVSGSYSQIIQQLASQTGSTLTFSQFGGSPQTLPDDAGGLLAAITNLPGTVKDRLSQQQYVLYVAFYGPSTIANGVGPVMKPVILV